MKDLLTARTSQLPREIVTPVDVLAPTPAQPTEPEDAHLDNQIPSQQDGASPPQADRQTDSHLDRKISSQSDRQPAVVWEKFGSQLKAGTQRRLKLAAVEQGREIRDIIQELVEQYLNSRLKP